MERLILLTWYS
jgi:hypothetical protein